MNSLHDKIILRSESHKKFTETLAFPRARSKFPVDFLCVLRGFSLRPSRLEALAGGCKKPFTAKGAEKCREGREEERLRIIDRCLFTLAARIG
jgi:hypothetical protein